MQQTPLDDAEERARASEAKYRSLFDYAPDGILIADARGVYLDANASICRMLGYSREEMIGKSGADIVALTEQEHLEPALAAIKSAPDYERMWTFRRKDGSTFRAEVIGTAMPDDKVLAMVRDVTERTRADARFRRLVESNAQGVMFWDGDGVITGANEALLRTIGYTVEDLHARRIRSRELTPIDYDHIDNRARAELAARGVCTPFEKEYVRKDGVRVPVLVGAAVFDDNPREGVSFVLDLTERKRLEQQLLRTQRLESIGTLAGGIAHDLNNVLAPIMLSIELLMESAKDADTRSLLSTMQTSARHGADLVHQVLSFARGMKGQRVLVNPVIPMGELYKVLKDTFPKSIELYFDYGTDIGSIAGDPTQIHQVFMNLCVNARDAMPNGGSLTLSIANVVLDETFAAMHLDARAGAYVLIEVGDNGIGMSKAVQERIFEPFYTTKEVGSGTGLGLSTSLAIVKSHGGFIHLYSEEGRGTNFQVYLPADTVVRPEAASAADQPRLPRGQNELILVVDDEEALRTILKTTLERFGYRVLVASNGAEAVEVYKKHFGTVNAVITDMAMPVMDGVATIRTLTALDPSVKIIGSSGLTDGEGIRSAIGAGVRAFLHKPYSAEIVLSTLRQVLAEGSDR